MKHNNESMQTVVETFFIEETVNLIHDNEALTKWDERVKELGLEGQTKVVLAKEKSPIPFLWMNNAIIATFETLCPTKSNIKDYDKTPIPVELLDAVALCNREGYFFKIQVWYNEKQKDPVIVGYRHNKGRSDWEKEYYADKYLIGRWADVKASLDQLIERAKKIFIESTKNELTRRIRQADRDLEDVELTADAKFGNGMPVTNMPF